MVATIYSSAWVLSKIIIIFPLTAMMTDQTQTVVIFIDILQRACARTGHLSLISMIMLHNISCNSISDEQISAIIHQG